MAERVRITDVSPRDGLQNEPGVISTADKVRLVELVAAAGVDEVEVTSFVSAKWVPQLGDAAEVVRGVRNGGKVMYSALVPNVKGMEAALACNLAAAAGGARLSKVSVFTAASETFSKRNTNASIAETIERFVPVVDMAHGSGLLVRGYVSCVVACPFEGTIAPAAVRGVVEKLIAIGVDEIDLGDTIGAGTAETVGRMLQEVVVASGVQTMWTLHLHDTFGRATECVRVALDLGIRSFDGSVAGLGGCPYASTPGKRAPGNIATETLVRTVHEAGFETGVDLDALAVAAEFARGIVRTSRSAE